MRREFVEQLCEVVVIEDDMIRLLGIRQREKETLREFLNRYHRVVLDLGAFNHP